MPRQAQQHTQSPRRGRGRPPKPGPRHKTSVLFHHEVLARLKAHAAAIGSDVSTLTSTVMTAYLTRAEKRQ